MADKHLSIEQIRHKFQQLNKERLENTEALMASKSRALIKVIPLLFHVNHSSLPGYVDEDTPSGVSAYAPDDLSIQTAKKHWRGFQYVRQAQWSVDIDALFLMGSCGTIAFSSKSDFDIWLCYRSGLERSKLKRLQKKARIIEKWFDAMDLEVHFFLMNASNFKKGKVSELSTESSGTAQHHILLDEFYRTSIWLAGKTPFWWFVAPGKEKNYEKIRQDLDNAGDLPKNDCVDFGGLHEIPSGEFFGAAVWQIYKGIDSPYKSILKISLMEAYANSYPQSSPLSAEFKQLVHGKTCTADMVDPYILMLSRIENYLLATKKTERIEVVRRSFYLKLNISLSNPREQDNWRKKRISQLVKSWGWDDEQIKHLDQKNKWVLEDVMAERKLLVLHLTESYSFLSGFARKYAKKRLINQKDLSILGRKLYAVFDRKPGKIEIFNRGIVDDLTESSITIMLLHGKDKRDHWHLYRGKVVGDQFKDATPLKHVFSLIEIVVWAHLNQLFSPSTQKLLYAPGTDVGNAELQTLLEIFTDVMANYSLVPETKHLLESTYVQHSEVFLNIGKQIGSRGSRVDKQLISGELDVLNYGSGQDSLIKTLEYFYITSWKEVFVYKYYGNDGIADWLCELLEMYYEASMSNKKFAKIIPNVHSFGEQVSHVLSKRINQLCSTVVDAFIVKGHSVDKFAYEVGKRIYCIEKDDKQEQFSYVSYDNLSKFMTSLAKPSVGFKRLAVSDASLKSIPLSKIYEDNKSDIIQLYLHKTKSSIVVYILDEFGALFFQKLALTNWKVVARNLNLFLRNVDERNQLMGDRISDEVDGFGGTPIVNNLISRDKFEFSVKPVNLPNDVSENSYKVQVSGDVVNKKTVFTFFCGAEEFSSLDWGSKIFREVAKHIMKKRKDQSKYYIYITDLTLSAVLLGKKSAHSAQTIELLQYKKRIEESLNKALVGL